MSQAHGAPGPLRVAILGAESSGKSTLAAGLAQRYRSPWVPEYLREFVDTMGRVPVAQDQIEIAATQLAREQQAAAAAVQAGARYLFCDTTPLMTAVYSRHYFGGADAGLARLAAEHQQHYGLTLVTAADIPWMADGLQRESAAVTRIIERLLLEELAARAIPYVLLEGDPEARLAQVERALS